MARILFCRFVQEYAIAYLPLFDSRTLRQVRPHTTKGEPPRHFLFVLALFLRGTSETLGVLRDKGLRKLDFQLCQFLAIGLFGIHRKPLGCGGLRELGFERERTATR